MSARQKILDKINDEVDWQRTWKKKHAGDGLYAAAEACSQKEILLLNLRADILNSIPEDDTNPAPAPAPDPIRQRIEEYIETLRKQSDLCLSDEGRYRDQGHYEEAIGQRALAVAYSRVSRELRKMMNGATDAD